MDRLTSIEAFVAAADAGSFTAAAEKLAIAKSAVSKRVADLERHLGLRLLNRGARGLALTSSGAAYYEDVRDALARLAEADRTASGADAEPRGLLRVAAPMSFGTLRLKQFVADFMTRWPELTVELDMTDRVVDIAAEGHDLAVRLGELRDGDLVARIVAPNRHLLCASPAYLQRRGMPAKPEELQGHDGLLYVPREAGGSWRLLVDGEPRSFRPRARMRCNNGEMLQDAALAGLGLAILPMFMAAPYLRTGELVPVLPECGSPGGALNAVYPRGRSAPAKVRVFIDALVAAYAPVADWDADLGA